ncbi:hypothetical protein PAE2_21 [Pseudomonas phage PAE2]|nr:hypothetical protein PAE2_21 [Pseudomonas phage PAE2]
MLLDQRAALTPITGRCVQCVMESNHSPARDDIKTFLVLGKGYRPIKRRPLKFAGLHFYGFAHGFILIIISPSANTIPRQAKNLTMCPCGKINPNANPRAISPICE